MERVVIGHKVIKVPEFVNSIGKSDLWNIGPVGILEKTIDRSNMSDRLSDISKIALRTFAILGSYGAVTACEQAFLAPEIIPTNVATAPEIGPATFPVIPTPEFLNNGIYETETYCSDDLALCAFHQFDQDGKALAPRVFTNSKINFDLDKNTIFVTGDSFIQTDSEVFAYSDQNGQKGYETVQVMSVDDATLWMQNMSEDGRGNMQAVIDEAKNKGVDVRILMKTALNIQKDSAGQDRLVDMAVGLAMSSGGEGATIVELKDTLDPLAGNDLLKDQQVAAVNFVPQFDGSQKLVMEVYPSDWTEIGKGQYVSPEFITVMDQVATSQNFTLMPNGTIQEKIVDGVKEVTGLSVDKKGQMTLLVNGEQISVDPTDVIFNDQDGGVSIKGYKQNAETGLWEPFVEVSTYTNEQLAQMTDEQKAEAIKNMPKEIIPLTTGENWEVLSFATAQDGINYAVIVDGATGTLKENHENSKSEEYARTHKSLIPKSMITYAGGTTLYDESGANSNIGIGIARYNDGTLITYVDRDGNPHAFYTEQDLAEVQEGIRNGLITVPLPNRPLS
ncbi:MAG TPA: hypothetical protein VFI61_01010 [Patescibacteria group bacterium]|nr:hypothetical protein [Patescibacteria group bacterium]